MKKLKQEEFYELLSITALTLLHLELTKAMHKAENGGIMKISNEIFTLEKALRLKKTGITLIGNL